MAMIVTVQTGLITTIWATVDLVTYLALVSTYKSPFELGRD